MKIVDRCYEARCASTLLRCKSISAQLSRLNDRRVAARIRDVRRNAVKLKELAVLRTKLRRVSGAHVIPPNKKPAPERAGVKSPVWEPGFCSRVAALALVDYLEQSYPRATARSPH